MIWGLNSKISHTVNLIIHLLNVILCYILSKVIFYKFNISDPGKIKVLLISFIYALHPTQIEAVAWISGRFDLLAAFFSFISLILIIKFHLNNKIISIAVCMLFFGFLCKESALLVVPIVYFLLYILNGFSGIYNKNTYMNILIFIALCFYFLLRYISLGDAFVDNNKYLLLNLSLLDRFLIIFFYIFEYLKNVIIPFNNIGPIHIFVEDVIGTKQWYFSALMGFLSLLTLLVYKNNKIVIFYVCFLIALFFVLQVILVFSGWNCISDRFLYFPLYFISVAIVLSISSLLEKYLKIKNIVIGGIIVWLLLLVVTTSNIVPYWKSNITLWGWQYIKTENSYARDSYINELLRINNIDLLDIEFNKLEKNEKLTIENPRLLLMYSTYLVRKGDAKSFYYLEKLAKEFSYINNDDLKNSYIEVKIQLAQAYLYIDNNKKAAREILEEVKIINPRNKNVIKLDYLLNK